MDSAKPRRVRQHLSEDASISPDENDDKEMLSEDVETGQPQMIFRRRAHKHWRERSAAAPNDKSAEGLKLATIEWSQSWYVGVALAMSVAFAMLLFRPKPMAGEYSLAQQIALYVYLAFTLRACYLSLGIIMSCAMWVQQASAMPAADYSPFLAACTLPEKPYLDDPGDLVPCLFGQLIIAAVPLCYLEYGLVGLVLALVALYRYLVICARNFYGWQRAMAGFEARLDVPRGTYVSEWGGYGEPTLRGYTLVAFHVMVGAFPSGVWAKLLYAERTSVTTEAERQDAGLL